MDRPMDPMTAYNQAGYAGPKYFDDCFEHLKKQFPDQHLPTLITAASRMAIACSIEMLASSASGAVEGRFSSALETIALGSVQIYIKENAP